MKFKLVRRQRKLLKAYLSGNKLFNEIIANLLVEDAKCEKYDKALKRV